MPIYEYRCDNGHTFDALQKFADEPLSECEVCGAPARRVLHPVAIHFKGSGFYTTDYGRKKTGSRDGKSETAASSESTSEASSSDGKSSDAKPASKPKAAEA
jgi:putative FmdB family regulatory protein